MPIYPRPYRPGELPFLTTRTYRRAQVFLSPRFCRDFLQRLEEVRQKQVAHSLCLSNSAAFEFLYYQCPRTNTSH
jgi:hypothetical protein